MDALHSLIAGRSVLELALVAIALVLLPSMSLYYGVKAGRAPAAVQGNLVGRYLQIMVRGWAIAAAVLFAWVAAGRPLNGLGLEWPPDAMGLAGLGLAVLVVLIFLFMAMFRFDPSKDELKRWKRQLDALKLAPRNLGELAAFLPVAVTAGVWEELFYRGFLMWFLAPATGVVGAIVASSLIFGAGHAYQGWRGVYRTTLVGCFFGGGYALTGSLWWLMAIHATADVFSGVLAYRVYAKLRAEGN